MKWTEGLEIQKVHRMKLANIPFTDAFHSAQKSITKIMPQNVATFNINNISASLPILLIYDFEGGY